MKMVLTGLAKTAGRVAAALLLTVACAAAAPTQGKVSLGKAELDKAVRAGMGRIQVIVFTDPDCPFCRKAEDYFNKRKDVTRYVFFKPLKMHPAAKPKVQYILSSRDKEGALREASTDAFDKGKLSQITPEGVKLQQEHEEIARENKITATPTFVINGTVVEGFDLKKLEPLLK